MRFQIVFLIGFVSGNALKAEISQSLVPSAPTSFTSRIPETTDLDSDDRFRARPGLHFRENGGDAKLEKISVRGSKPSDIAVSLEGIRLNSPSNGEFDLGLLSPHDFGIAQLIRGGYAPYSSNPSAELRLKLPEEPRSLAQISGGSYGAMGLYLESPVSTLSFHRSKNDFSYNDGGTLKSRTHNESRRMTARAWHRKKNWQIWTQVLYSDLDLPGPASSPTPQATSETFVPTLAYQGRSKDFEWAVWGTYQEQSYKDPSFSYSSTNRSFSTGTQGTHRYAFNDILASENILEWAQDKLSSNTFHSPYRHTLSHSVSLFWNPWKSSLIHPRLRTEFVSDLEEELVSIHPGLGGRHHLLKDTDLLWNLAWISRTPNFQEMYAEAPGALPNPDLKRQDSYQGDIGYESRISDLRFQIQQALFANRTENILSSTFENNLYQVKNRGTSYAWGLENQILWSPIRMMEWEASYTLQRVTLNDAQQPYQPTHSFRLEPRVYLGPMVVLSLPVYARSSVATEVANEKIRDQWDLGFLMKTLVDRYSFQLRIYNLLGWDRKETRDYPLSNESFVRASASIRF